VDTRSLTKRLILDAQLERSVIEGTLTDPSGAQREFHGWLALAAALEAALRTPGGAEERE
jgi:hypothetical protein